MLARPGTVYIRTYISTRRDLRAALWPATLLRGQLRVRASDMGEIGRALRCISHKLSRRGLGSIQARGTAISAASCCTVGATLAGLLAAQWSPHCEAATGSGLTNGEQKLRNETANMAAADNRADRYAAGGRRHVVAVVVSSQC
jgi:hypothetical protein